MSELSTITNLTDAELALLRTKYPDGYAIRRMKDGTEQYAPAVFDAAGNASFTFDDEDGGQSTYSSVVPEWNSEDGPVLTCCKSECGMVDVTIGRMRR